MSEEGSASIAAVATSATTASTVADAEPVPQAVPAGATLRAARERAGLSVSDVAQRLKYSARQVEALEEGRSAQLPSLTFQRGFVRGYARLLGLDANALVASLELQAQPDNGPSTLQLQKIAYTPAAMPAQTANHAAWPWIWAMLAAVAGIGGYILYGWEAPASVRRETAVAISAAPVGAVSGVPVSPVATAEPGRAAPASIGAAPAPASATSAIVGERAIPLPQASVEAAPLATSGKLRLQFAGDSWTEVRQANGSVVYSGTGTAGMERWVDGQGPFDLVIGNAKQVKLFYRGDEVDLQPYIKLSVARLQLK